MEEGPKLQPWYAVVGNDGSTAGSGRFILAIVVVLLVVYALMRIAFG